MSASRSVLLLAAAALVAAGCEAAPPRAPAAPRDRPAESGRVFLSETVEAVLARLEGALASNDAAFQSSEVSRDFVPSYEGIADQIRTSVQNYDVERVRIVPEGYTSEREGGSLVADVRWDLRRRGRSSGDVESLSGRTRLHYRLENGGRYRLIGQEGDVLLGRP